MLLWLWLLGAPLVVGVISLVGTRGGTTRYRGAV